MTTRSDSCDLRTDVQIQPLEALRPADWDAFVRADREGSVFHTTGWIWAVTGVFGHRCRSLAVVRGGEICAVLPLVEVRSLLGGTMLVSVPYGIYGGAIGDADGVSHLLNEAVRLGERIGAKSIELRSVTAKQPDWEVAERHATFRKPLPRSVEECLGALPRKARAAARLARDRHGLTVTFGDEGLRDVWRLYCQNMRRLASLAYPFSFFEALMRELPERPVVSVFRYQGRVIGGLMTLVYRGTAMPYFVGVDARFGHLNPYNFIYLTAMERAVADGCHTFDFGRSRLDNEGACAFKRNQGFEAEVLRYQTYVAEGETAVALTPSNPRFAMARRVWPMLPSVVTRPLGGWLSKHVPG